MGLFCKGLWVVPLPTASTGMRPLTCSKSLARQQMAWLLGLQVLLTCINNQSVVLNGSLSSSFIHAVKHYEVCCWVQGQEKGRLTHVLLMDGLDSIKIYCRHTQITAQNRNYTERFTQHPDIVHRNTPYDGR